jgi:hypothetical protein
MQSILAPTVENKILEIEQGAMVIGLRGEQLVFTPITDNSIDLGSSSNRFKDIYAANATIQTSDEREKDDIQDLQPQLDFLMSLNPVSYKLKQGTSGRRHWGLIAQEVEQAMNNNQLTDMDFAGLIKSPVYEQRETGEYTDEIVGYEDVQVGTETKEEFDYYEFVQVEVGMADDYDDDGNVIDQTPIYETKQEPVYKTVEEPIYESQPIIEKRPIMEDVQIDTRYGLRYEEIIPAAIGVIQYLAKEIELLKSSNK